MQTNIDAGVGSTQGGDMFRDAARKSSNSELECSGSDRARWMRITRDLLSSSRGDFRPPRQQFGEPSAPTEAFVLVLERPTAKTAIVFWRDAGRCYYGEQVWMRGHARTSGRCALSRQVISRGDPVYKPRWHKTSPLNAFCMILANQIELASRDFEHTNIKLPNPEALNRDLV
jgi:hypothetical protein